MLHLTVFSTERTELLVEWNFLTFVLVFDVFHNPVSKVPEFWYVALSSEVYKYNLNTVYLMINVDFIESVGLLGENWHPYLQSYRYYDKEIALMLPL